MPFFADDYDEDEAAYLRAQDRAERRRLAPHWCSTCLGHTGAGSPCAPDEPETAEEAA